MNEEKIGYFGNIEEHCRELKINKIFGDRTVDKIEKKEVIEALENKKIEPLEAERILKAIDLEKNKGYIAKLEKRKEPMSVETILNDLKTGRISVPQSNEMLKQIHNENKRELYEALIPKPERLTTEKILEDGKKGVGHNPEINRQIASDRRHAISELLRPSRENEPKSKSLDNIQKINSWGCPISPEQKKLQERNGMPLINQRVLRKKEED